MKVQGAWTDRYGNTYSYCGHCGREVTKSDIKCPCCGAVLEWEVSEDETDRHRLK